MIGNWAIADISNVLQRKEGDGSVGILFGTNADGEVKVAGAGSQGL